MLKTISLLIAAILAFSVPAAAQNRFFPREVVMIQLADRYRETAMENWWRCGPVKREAGPRQSPRQTA